MSLYKFFCQCLHVYHTLSKCVAELLFFDRYTKPLKYGIFFSLISNLKKRKKRKKMNSMHHTSPKRPHEFQAMQQKAETHFLFLFFFWGRSPFQRTFFHIVICYVHSGTVSVVGPFLKYTSDALQNVNWNARLKTLTL